ncbi:uncharacterized protein LOC120074371 [Benincasa hispida]|uniref:uncharacterized protein LOC120074371 n=1 Tax=Benincasa hispida TaxID=102211 RepID=UPI0019002D5C|nr:uncharacterized protein LOC120074371 [Benincasa hispida]
MEKEEQPKFASTPNLEHQANGVFSGKNEKSVSDGTDAAKNAKSGCQFLENAPLQNQQCTAFLQRALNPQHAGEKSPSTAPAAVNERLQLPQNLANLQHQLSPPPQPQQFVISSQPFWVQPQPSISFGATEGSWQAPVAFGAGASPRCQPQAPNFYYPVGYPTYSGFPGPRDASIWWGQTQPLLFPGLSNYPRASCGFASSQSWPMPIPSCVTSSSGQPLLRGVIKPPEKLSQKHQRLWEAQSAENVQLWSLIGELQGELADYKGRLSKLEVEISSLRSAATDEPAVEVGNDGITVRGQPAKRGRSKRAIAPVGSQPPLQPRTRGRKPAFARTKVEEAKPTFLGKDSLNKVNDKHKDFTSLDITEQDKNEGISATINQNNGSMEINEGTLKMPAPLDNQVLQQCPEIQSCGIEFKPSSLLKSNYEENFIWSLGIISEDSEQNNFSIASPTIYTNGNVSRQGIARWNFKHEDEAAELGFPAVEHKKEDEEMVDEFSSGPEEIETKNGSSWC